MKIILDVFAGRRQAGEWEHSRGSAVAEKPGPKPCKGRGRWDVLSLSWILSGRKYWADH